MSSKIDVVIIWNYFNVFFRTPRDKDNLKAGMDILNTIKLEIKYKWTRTKVE